MSQALDNNLKRLFAQAPVVGSDEPFVAALARQASVMRRRRRVATVALLAVAAVGAAALLAPLAPVASVSSAGSSLLGLPEQLVTAAASAGRLPGAIPAGVAAAVIGLIVAGAVWIARRT
jgi:hypothetical protein